MQQTKKLISAMTNKAIVANITNHINELDLLNKSLDNLRKFISTINYNDCDSKYAIDIYYRAIHTFDHIGNKFSTIRHLSQVYTKEIKNPTKEISNLLNTFKKKCINLNQRIERLEVNQIEQLFLLTPDANF